MEIKQFEDKNLSHYSYAVLSNCKNEMVLIDPSRNIQPYLDHAKEKNATIIGIIETHPHADFVSGHMELHNTTGANIYVSKDVHAIYPHKTFDGGDKIEFGKIVLSAINTPGHSPDSISILMEHDGKQYAVFTGDTLFIGDCGRPDLREGAGKLQGKRHDLAANMYHSLRDKLMVLNDDVLVYPAHGAGTLCGKNLSKDSSSTIGKEKKENWSLQPATENEFIENLLADQPFVPAYFPYDVDLNRKGADAMEKNISAITIENATGNIEGAGNEWIVDTRDEKDFKNGHLPHAVNLMENGKFETWLGSIIKPEEKFYLVGNDETQVKRMLQRVASIGYETSVIKAVVLKDAEETMEQTDVAAFKENQQDYTIVDVRNKPEVEKEKIFDNSLSIPLAEIRGRYEEIPTNKPIIVHCAGGYRSAAASSILQAKIGEKTKVFDLGEGIKEFSSH